MLDFPASPTNGQKYPTPAVAGVPQYTWDGEKWTTVGGSIVSATPATATPLMDATPAVVGTTTKFAREDHVHPVDTAAVRTEQAQSLTTTQQQQARQNVYAAPFDALAYNGMQINGGMEVSQELGTTGVTSSAKYICDGWILVGAGFASVRAQQSVLNVNGFSYCLNFSVSAAQPSLGASDFFGLMHQIEGYRTARLNWGTASAQPITIGFWSAHHRTGLYSGQILNGANNRSYIFTYTQIAADALQYNVVTIPGCTDGVWAKDNTGGLILFFTIASGSTYTGSAANTWLTGNYFAAPGQVNAVAATSDVFRITGVVVLPGIEAPSAARSPFIMRSYDQELATCQRYYEQLLFPTTGQGQALNSWVMSSTGNYNYHFWKFYRCKRSTPTFVLGPAVVWQNGSPSVSLGIDGVLLNLSGNFFFVSGVGGTVAAIADARL